MYTAHRDAILDYEKKFDPLNAAQIKAEPGIKDIYNELQPALFVLKNEFNIPTNFVIEEAQMLAHTLLEFRTDLNKTSA